jgi:signal transduction histidine kinase/CheY-like chemotaxis protein
VFVVAPIGRDAQLICEMLAKRGFAFRSYNDIREVCRQAADGIGAIILTEEALVPGAMEELNALLDAQPPWSDIGFILLTSHGDRVQAAVRAKLQQRGARAVILIERPVRRMTLASTVESLVQSRRRQYQIRDYLEERVRNEARLREKQKLESVGTLAGGIAHDFNNLLGGVLAQAELALSELAAGVSPEEELGAIREVAIRGSEIVRELMIYAGKETAVVTNVDVSRIITEMLELLKVSISKHAVLETHLAKDLPLVEANAARIRQIVVNLVTNASEAIADRDGIIRVTTALVKADVNTLEGNSDQPADGDCLELKISDTGCGMSPETQARVFDPFFTTKAAGHGLGLAIVYGLVRGLGGAIRITSEPGEGTTFQILIPRSKANAKAANEATVSEPAAASPQETTILVVEDEDILRRAVAKMLRNNGFAVLEAADGTAAIDLLRANGARVDAVLLDMTIPGTTSAEVVTAAARARPEIKVILTSAYSKEMVAGGITAPQIRGFVRKPSPLHNLLQVIRSAVSSS